MNFSKSLVTLTAFLSLVLASPHPVEANGYCQISDADYNEMEELIIKNDENAEKTILNMLGECRLRRSDRAMKFLLCLLCFDKFDLFEVIAERADIKGDEKVHMISSMALFKREFKSMLLEQREDDHRYCEISDADYFSLEESIRKNDENAEKMILSMLGERRLRRSERANEFMASLLRHHKFDLFDLVAERSDLEGDSKAEFVLSTTIFNGEFKRAQILLEERNFSPEERDQKLSGYLVNSIVSKRINVGDFLLSQDFKFFQPPRYPITYYDVNLEELKQLIARHPERAAEISPKDCHFESCCGVNQGLFLIELAHHCAEVSRNTANPISFDPTKIFRIMILNFCYEDKKAKIVYRLCGLGADVNLMMYDEYKLSIIDYLRLAGNDYKEWYEAAFKILFHSQSRHLKSD